MQNDFGFGAALDELFGNKPRTKKPTDRRTLTNILGFSILIVILLGIGGVGIWEWGLHRETQKILDESAARFAANDKNFVLKWASGAVKDRWDNSLVVESNDDEAIQLLSKGRDGKLGTKDDILSQRLYRQPKPVVVLPQKEPVPEPKPLEETTTLKDRAGKLWNRMWGKTE